MINMFCNKYFCFRIIYWKEVFFKILILFILFFIYINDVDHKSKDYNMNVAVDVAWMFIKIINQ